MLMKFKISKVHFTLVENTFNRGHIKYMVQQKHFIWQLYFIRKLSSDLNTQKLHGICSKYSSRQINICKQ